jgi:protein-S-isoprenylcysteine O-methyltransferase Ste14
MSSGRGRRELALLVTALFLVLAPGTVAVYIPWRITRWHLNPGLPLQPLLELAGGALIIAGTAGLIACFLRFALEGLGTPAPPFPTQKLIVTGMYRYVRNPMYVAVIAVVLGQALAFRSWKLAAYGACVWTVMHLFVLLYEEPKLRQTFGAEYETYLLTVPRWIPRRIAVWPDDA